jgi:hypothetical protein
MFLKNVGPVLSLFHRGPTADPPLTIVGAAVKSVHREVA